MYLSRFLFCTFVISTLLPLVGCKQVTIPDGKIPAQYQVMMQNYLKTYKGAFGNNPGIIKFELVQDKLVASFTGKINDVTGNEKCRSQIGDLQSIQVNDLGTQLEAASFAFSANLCPEIQGHTLDFGFVQNLNRLDISAVILKEIKEIQVCQSAPAGSSATPNCKTDYQYYYLSGSFSK